MSTAGTGSPLNYSNVPERDSCEADRQVSQVVFRVLYSVLFVAGIMMNSLAVWVFFQIPSKSNFIVYLKNTVVADLLMTLTFPFKILVESTVRTPVLQFVVCQITSVSFYFTMYISIMFLGLISADRYQKAARPFGGSASCRPRSAKICSVAVWLVMFLLSLPNMVLIKGTSMPEGQRKCSSLKTDMGLKWHEIVTFVCQVIFWSNLAIIVVSYLLISRELYKSYQRTQSGSSSRANRRVNFNVFIVLGVFFVCFVPFHFARIPYTLSQTRDAFDCSTQIALYYTKESTLCLAAFNACLDPLIYFFLCRSFRNTLFEKLHIRMQRLTLHQRGDTSTNNEIAL